MCIPEKSGQNSTEPWNFLKAHASDHIGSEVLANGTTAYIETQVFETGHNFTQAKYEEID